MPLKKSYGNMYPWVTHTHSHLGGRCPHKCDYCYVNHPKYGRSPRYEGPVRLIEKELAVDYGEGKTIFIEHMADLLAEGVPDEMVSRILQHCREYPKNTYVFQSKNPGRFLRLPNFLPPHIILGTTIETDRDEDVAFLSKAPSPHSRYLAMARLKFEFGTTQKRFVTIEPIMDFDLDILAKWIGEIRPDFLNIGADSKGHHLPEPPAEKVWALIDHLKVHYGIEVREKHNLERLKKG